MNKASKAISLVLVGSGAVLLGYTAFRPRTPNYYYDGASSTQPSSYHGSRSGHRGGGFFPVPFSSGRSYSGSPSHSSGSYSGSSHSSGTSRGGFGSSGRSSVS